MSKDNVIDFGSFRKRPAPIGNGIENENRAELEAMMGTIPAHGGLLASHIITTSSK